MKNEDRQSYQRLRIPVARYTRHRMRVFYVFVSFIELLYNFSIVAFRGPFLNFMPSTSIFADRSTKQTIIHTKRGGNKSCKRDGTKDIFECFSLYYSTIC